MRVLSTILRTTTIRLKMRKCPLAGIFSESQEDMVLFTWEISLKFKFGSRKIAIYLKANIFARSIFSILLNLYRCRWKILFLLLVFRVSRECMLAGKVSMININCTVYNRPPSEVILGCSWLLLVKKKCYF